MQRVLGEVPHVEKVFWDWRAQEIWLRFEKGRVANERTIKATVENETMFSAGPVTFLTSEEELPDELR